MKNYELPISPNYVCNWGIKEAVREILQNAIDSEQCGYPKKVLYSPDCSVLTIINEGARLPLSSLVLGCSSKSDIDGMIGKFGEGYKLALVVLLRKGFSVNIINGMEEWTPSFVYSDKFETQVLNIEVNPLDSNAISNDVVFAISGIDKELYNELLISFPCIDEDYGNVIESDNGCILLDNKFKGKMYVEGLFIQSDDNFKYGYNFNSDAVCLDRDRKAINYYELRKLTAASVVTAEKCCPELFKAISDSYTDVKDIKEVLDDASDEFLKEYRDMLYEEKGLDENTLVATESVMKQLQQMNVGAPIAKGTEIESYLIAKANDKLGLIYEAKKAANKKNDEDDAWDYVRDTHWMRLKCWFAKYGKRVSKEGKQAFQNIIDIMEPSDFVYIKKYFPEDFEWTEDNFDDLEMKIKNQT